MTLVKVTNTERPTMPLPPPAETPHDTDTPERGTE